MRGPDLAESVLLARNLLTLRTCPGAVVPYYAWSRIEREPPSLSNDLRASPLSTSQPCTEAVGCSALLEAQQPASGCSRSCRADFFDASLLCPLPVLLVGEKLLAAVSGNGTAAFHGDGRDLWRLRTFNGLLEAGRVRSESP